MPSPKLLTGAAAPARRAIAVPQVPDYLPILGLAPRVNDRIVAAVRQAHLGYEPVFAELRMSGATLMATLSHIGAELDSHEPALFWKRLHEVTEVERPPAYLGLEDADVIPWDFEGAFRFSLDGQRWLACRAEIGNPHRPNWVALIAGPSLRAILALVDRLRHAEAELLDRQLHVYGSLTSDRDIAEVPESDLILEPELKSTLLSLVDGFSRMANDAQRQAQDGARGIMLLGRPGTGKTFAIRHILSRLDGFRRYLYVPAASNEMRVPGKGFTDLMRDVCKNQRPSVVIVEDIDRLYESGAVTPQHFLNALDGLLRPGAPILWIATSNDPSDLPDNIVDRPGRFDRILVFPAPAFDERIRLLKRYAMSALEDFDLRRLAEAADGLTGAHLREACRSAEWTLEMDGGEYVELLGREVAGLRTQQEAATKYGRGLRGEVVGF